MIKAEDENEHSLEMHLPYIKHIFGDSEFKLVPIVVGRLEYESAQKYGKVRNK